VPTKTEQGDLWQMLGASQGDFQRFIAAPTSALDAFNTIPQIFNLCDAAQCPGIVISDLLISEGTFSVPVDKLDMQPEINRGALITEGRPADDGGLADPATREGGGYKRYEITEDGVSPRAVLGLEGYVHVVSTDEHDEDGVLISDEYTNPHKRRAMVEKRARKFEGVASAVPAPELEGPAEADVTLVGWGSTWGVIQEACEQLADLGVTANHLPVKWIVPLHGDAILETLSKSKRVIIVENNHSGQFARYLRSETGFKADGHIRKYDGEPFMPHHIVAGVQEQLAGNTDLYVPTHEIMV
jgi:2-oxoglutarate ferredoxin oxidoreductase subunit alpha